MPESWVWTWEENASQPRGLNVWQCSAWNRPSTSRGSRASTPFSVSPFARTPTGQTAPPQQPEAEPQALGSRPAGRGACRGTAPRGGPASSSF